MREWWVNVYPLSEMREKHGGCAVSREICEGARGPTAGYLIHVRLKPEGAPKRYASEANRRVWEIDPEMCQKLVGFGYPPERLL